MDRGMSTVRAPPVDRSRKRCGGVHDHEVTGLQELGQVVEPPVLDKPWPGDQEPDAVARHAAALGWRRGIAAGRQREPGDGRGLLQRHGATAMSAAR